MDATTNWAQQRCIFRNSSLSCFFFFFFHPSKKQHNFKHLRNSTPADVCLVLQAGVCGIRAPCFAALAACWACRLRQPLQHAGPCSAALAACWSMGCSPCSTLAPWVAAALTAALQAPVGLGTFPHSTHSRRVTRGVCGERFFSLLFWAGFCCCNVHRSAGMPSVVLFHYRQITASPVGSLWWGSDIRPLNLQCVGVSAVVITWQGHS